MVGGWWLDGSFRKYYHFVAPYVQVRFDGLANRQAEDHRGVDLPEDQEEGGDQTGDNRLNLGGIYIIFFHI